MKRFLACLGLILFVGWAPLPNLDRASTYLPVLRYKHFPVLFESVNAIVVNPRGYQIQLAEGLLSPADVTTYWTGSMPAIAAPATAGGGGALVPAWILRTGAITSAYVTYANFGTLGTTETSTLSVDVSNGTQNGTVTAAFVTNPAAGSFSAAMNLPVTAGQYVNFKWITPTWATNPTNVSISGAVWIDVP